MRGVSRSWGQRMRSWRREKKNNHRIKVKGEVQLNKTNCGQRIPIIRSDAVRTFMKSASLKELLAEIIHNLWQSA